MSGKRLDSFVVDPDNPMAYIGLAALPDADELVRKLDASVTTVSKLPGGSTPACTVKNHALERLRRDD